MIRTTCGIDTIRISRIGDVIKRKGVRFFERVYTPAEIALCESKGMNRVASLAARFAGKEAVVKALGTGVGLNNIRFNDIEILADENQRPVVTLHREAKEYYRKMGGTGKEVSLSHDGDQAVAICVMQFEYNGSEDNS
jgi:holo-[acyl-carrier protein] synthase